jgi:hypothetical protein
MYHTVSQGKGKNHNILHFLVLQGPQGLLEQWLGQVVVGGFQQK